MPVDRAAAERAFAALLEALGHDTRSELLAGTPARAVEALLDDLLIGRSVNVAEVVSAGAGPAAPNAGLVAVTDVRVATLCPHHFLPGVGRATVVYRPGELLLGIGTVARVVEALARRLTLQESIGEDVVDALMRHAGARGAWCRLEMLHTCLAVRGARQPDATVVSVAAAGELAGDAGARAVSLVLGSTAP